MFRSTFPPVVVWVRAVKYESVGSRNVDTAQKFPSPICPSGMVGPTYRKVRFGRASSSSGSTRSGVAPVLATVTLHPLSARAEFGTSPPKS